MIDLAARFETTDSQQLAGVIHDDVLQSLGAAVLGVDLARRLHKRERYEQALAELGGIADALSLALVSSDRLLPQIRQAAPPSAPPLPRPSRFVLVDAVGPATMARPATSPDEIVQTIATCEAQVRRCQHYYTSGLGDETMQELGLLLQRLEFVTHAFRTLMNGLRQTVDQSALLLALARSA